MEVRDCGIEVFAFTEERRATSVPGPPVLVLRQLDVNLADVDDPYEPPGGRVVVQDDRRR